MLNGAIDWNLPTDHAEFSAQIRAEDTHREGGRHPEDDQQPVFPRNAVHCRHCLPERRGQLCSKDVPDVKPYSHRVVSNID